MMVEADQEALTSLLVRQMGNRWVLWRFGGKDRLVLVSPRVEVLPGGIYLSGRLRSPTPEVDTAVEVRLMPRVVGTSLRVSPDTVAVLQPTGALGFVPRQVLTRWLRSSAGRRELERFAVDLSPLIHAIGEPGRARIQLRLGFGNLRLVLTIR